MTAIKSRGERGRGFDGNAKLPIQQVRKAGKQNGTHERRVRVQTVKYTAVRRVHPRVTESGAPHRVMDTANISAKVVAGVCARLVVSVFQSRLQAQFARDMLPSTNELLFMFWWTWSSELRELLLVVVILIPALPQQRFGRSN